MFRKVKRYWHNLTHPVVGEVWELHRVTSSRSTNDHYAPYDISPMCLESLIIEYKTKGYEFVSINEVVRRIKRDWKVKRDNRFVSITLDDGYADNYDVAFPIFKKYNIPFCIYVTTGYVLGTHMPREGEYIPMLSPNQLYDLAKSDLCTIGVHTMSHPHLAELTLAEQSLEIVNAKNLLEQWVDKEIQHIASPFGSYNADTIYVVKDACFLSHVAAWGGDVRLGSDAFSIPRCRVDENKFIEKIL